MALQELVKKAKSSDWKTTSVGLVVFLVASGLCVFGKIDGETWLLSLGVAGVGYYSSDKK